MKRMIAAFGLAALASSAALAEPITRHTITGYSASAAVAEGVPIDKPAIPAGADAATPVAADGSASADPGYVAEGPDGRMYQAPQKLPPKRETYGLFGLSWRQTQ